METNIAIVGMAGKFPKCDNINDFWENIKNGNELISDLSNEDILKAGGNVSDLNNPSYVKRKGILEDIEYFDAEFFKYSPKDAKFTDPQHRIMLQTCYHAMEDYGFNPNIHSKNVGIFLSSSFSTYLLHNLSNRPGIIDGIDQHQLCMAHSNDFLSTRISYKLNLTGPAQTIQTACSSSLVAINHAYQSLINYDCNAALAGGISITTPSKLGYIYKKDGIASKDGRCRPFDDNASGTVAGNGVGVVVLKRLEDAIKEQDRIYAVIRGSAINNDGSNKMSFTAPSAKGQNEVISMAHYIADISPDTIGLIEAHGTATSLGDPIEIQGLKQAFSRDPNITFTPNSCAITSTKANTGHLDAAAGVTGFIKAALALYHSKLPPSINFTKLNKQINFKDSPFYINTKLQNWTKTDHPRRAGVSAFGIGGTNAHIILEEFKQDQNRIIHEDKFFILPISTHSKDALAKAKKQLKNFILSHEFSYEFIEDLAYTLQQRRIEQPQHDYIICTTANNQFQIYDDYNQISNIDNAICKALDRWRTNQEVNWQDFFVYKAASCISTPLYPFAKKSYWIETAKKEEKSMLKESEITIDHNKLSNTNNIGKQLHNILSELLENDNINPQSNFADIGADSFMLLQFQMEISSKLSINIGLGDFVTYSTLEKLTNFCQTKSTIILPNPPIAKNASLIVEIKEGNTKTPPLWCIHPAGGVTTIFSDLANNLNYDQRVLGIRASGLYEGEDIDTDVQIMARKYIKSIKAFQPTGPYLLLGGSLGGTIAFEIAQCLYIQGDQVSFLGMLDSPPPNKSAVIAKIPDSNHEIFEYIKTLSPEMANSLSEMVKANNSAQERFFNVWRGHSYSSQNYHVNRPYRGNVIYFRAKERDTFLAQNMETNWLPFIEDGIEIYEVPGNHLTMYKDCNVIRISEVLNKKLNNFRNCNDRFIPETYSYIANDVKQHSIDHNITQEILKL